MPDVIKRSEFMKKYLKNNRRLIHNFKFVSLRSIFYALCSMLSAHVFKLLALSSMLLAFLILCWILFPNRASSGPYLDSAHGNSIYGVNRPRTSGFGYAVGNCAHCHEQHASINGQTQTPYGYELFYDHWVEICDLFCYRCHNQGGVEMQVNNYPYSVNFGGEPLFYESIYKQFCDLNSTGSTCGSRHNLVPIRNLIDNNAFGWGYPANPDPCSACHNPHTVQRIGSKQYHAPYNPDKSPISRPSEHANNPTNLWGDDYQVGCPLGKKERLICYASSVVGVYQSPYYGNTTGTMYEPSGNSTPTDGSDLPDYVSFCLDCHSKSETGTKVIHWDTAGDKHGGKISGDVDCGALSGFENGDLRAPYNDALKEAGYNYVLSCTDCHEPHGAKNRTDLLRRFINGEAVPADTAPCMDSDVNDWIAICERCHTNIHVSFGNCTVCHGHNTSIGCPGGTTRTF
jgi:hypothetical protein